MKKIKLKSLLKPLALTVSLLALFAAVLEFPVLKRAWVRHEVAERVVEVRGAKDRGGGTGFQVEASSGIAYIVTNSHVCELAQKDSKNENFVLVKRQGHWMKRRVLEVSDKADLCLLEGLPGLSGLKLGNSPQVGEMVSAIGHPRLGPITMVTGEVVRFIDVAIPHHLMPSGDKKKDKFFNVSNESCNQPKNEIVKKEFFLFGFIPLGEMPVCMVKETNSVQTNLTIFGGNSGSPMIDSWGRVVGVVFAADSSTNWGFAVNVDHLKDLLSHF